MVCDSSTIDIRHRVLVDTKDQYMPPVYSLSVRATGDNLTAALIDNEQSQANVISKSSHTVLYRVASVG